MASSSKFEVDQIPKLDNDVQGVPQAFKRDFIVRMLLSSFSFIAKQLFINLNYYRLLKIWSSYLIAFTSFDKPTSMDYEPIINCVKVSNWNLLTKNINIINIPILIIVITIQRLVVCSVNLFWTLIIVMLTTVSSHLPNLQPMAYVGTYYYRYQELLHKGNCS